MLVDHTRTVYKGVMSTSVIDVTTAYRLKHDYYFVLDSHEIM